MPATTHADRLLRLEVLLRPDGRVELLDAMATPVDALRGGSAPSVSPVTHWAEPGGRRAVFIVGLPERLERA